MYASFDLATQKITFNSALIANGNIGIGTTSPTEALDINGTMTVNGNLNANRLTRYNSVKPYAYYNNPTIGTLVSGYGIINYQIGIYDTHNAVSAGTNWKFTVPTGCQGYYLISAGLHPNALSNIALFVNGVIKIRLAQLHAGTVLINGSYTLYLNAGDYIDVRCSVTSFNSTTEVNWISIACLELA